MHKLLQRQIRRILEPTKSVAVPSEFLRAIDSAYAQADEDRRLLERAMELTSEELLQRNQAMRRSLALLQATLEATDEGILVIDNQREIESFNQRFVDIWNHPVDILERRDGQASTAHAATQVVDPDAFLARLEELYEQPELEGFDEIELRSGRLIERYTRPMVDSVGSAIVGRVWSFRDVTEKRQLEGQIRQSQKMEALGQLAGGIAHDFNNLLTVITGSCDLTMQRTAGSDPVVERLLAEVAGAARRASDLTSQLLAFSRQDVQPPEPLCVDDAIRELEGMLQRLLREDIRWTTRLDAHDVRVLADPSRFQQVVLNLVINASDAVERGGMIEVATSLVEPAGMDSPRLLLSVKDNGAGMPPDVRQRIFDPFFTTKAPGAGTGLGLATVYGIVQQLGGTIDVDSTPGQGTEFRIELPTTELQPRLVEPSGETSPISGARILAVEDDPSVRLILGEMLSLLDGAEVHVAASPAEALAQFGSGGGAGGPLDLLISDIVMPEVNGFELAAELAAAHADLRVLFVSGYDPTASEVTLPSSMVTDFLNKPFDTKTLLNAIHDILICAPSPRAS